MRQLCLIAAAVIGYSFAMLPAAAFAAGPALATIGPSWDGPRYSLQSIVDQYLGSPGALNVETDYVGARIGDPDPWYWVGRSVPALLIKEINGNPNGDELGWYRETGVPPSLDGADGGRAFGTLQRPGSATVVIFPNGTTRFGFYLNTHTTVETASGPQNQVFYTNRHYNGRSTLRTPNDGNVQALVFDVSRWKGPNAWLVCFEDLDAGGPITPCCSGTDNDYNDFIFLVTALGAIPTTSLTFGALKALYR